jgi:hypothetical protein
MVVALVVAGACCIRIGVFHPRLRLFALVGSFCILTSLGSACGHTKEAAIVAMVVSVLLLIALPLITSAFN